SRPYVSFFITRPHPRPTPFPYTTLFRSNGSPYVDDFRAASAAVAKRLHHGPWRLAYQSRSGNPRDPWLEPDVNDALKDLGSSGRSEEHTSELQSRFDLVCRLLLEKKKRR